MLREAFLVFCVGVAAVASSPNAEYIEALYKYSLQEGSRISNNILEDALLDVVSINLVKILLI